MGTGQGVDRFLELVIDAEEEYEKDYRIEYERLREAKKEAEKTKSQKLVDRHKSEHGAGKEVSMLIHSVPKESGNNCVHLRHHDDEEEQKEEESFKLYIDKHKKDKEERIKKSNQ